MPRKTDSQNVTNAILDQKLTVLTDTVKEFVEATARNFKGVHDRQDQTNGRISKAETDIVRIKSSQWYERAMASLIVVLVGIVVYFLK